MKVRTDFVSNSSSCSFMIYLQTDKDVIEFKKILHELLLYTNGSINMSYDKYNSADAGCIHSENDEPIKGSYAFLYVGEDHYIETIERYQDLVDFITENSYKFKVYRDPWAHYTFGKNK